MNKMQEAISESDGARQVLPWELPRFRNWLAVARMHALWEKHFSKELGPLGIQIAHYDVLANVFHSPGLTQQQLAEKLLVGRSAMSMLLPDLERRGLILRQGDESDRRVRRLTLTAEGEALTRRAMAVHVAGIERIMTVLSDEECRLVGDMMWRVVAALET